MRRLIRIAIRSVLGQARRYVFVVAVLTLGFAFITVATSIAEGMRSSVTNAALRHYAGHVFVVGRDKDAESMMVVDDPRAVFTAIERSGAPVTRLITRVHEFNGASVFFQGDAVRLKDLFGVDFREEADLFRTFEYAEGAFDPDWGDDVIIVSKPTADRLKVRVGDRIVVRLQNRNGQLDTRSLVVAAVTADASIYGYARAYVARGTLGSLMAIEPANYSVVGVVLPNLGDAERWAGRIHEELSRLLPVSDPIDDRADLTSEFRSRWEGVRYFTIALPVYISEVTALLAAIELGSYLLLAMIGLVVLAAVLVTYRVVLHDRTREIGTMLAVGFGRPWILAMLLTEAFVLVLTGIAAGSALSLAATFALSFVSFDWIPGFEIFLDAGRLSARYTPGGYARNTAVVFATVIPSIIAMTTAHVHRRIPLLLKGQTA